MKFMISKLAMDRVMKNNPDLAERTSNAFLSGCGNSKEDAWIEQLPYECFDKSYVKGTNVLVAKNMQGIEIVPTFSYADIPVFLFCTTEEAVSVREEELKKVQKEYDEKVKFLRS